MISTTALLALVGSVSAEILWDGRANDYADSSFLEEWSWSNQEGPYQWYIHGDGSADSYVKLDSEYKNPADTGSKQGIQVTNDKTSSWNGQSMLRTELIPQTDAAINKGKVYYHFSMAASGTNPPDASGEHQINFFESHFTEMKFGGSDSSLHWFAGGESQWDAELTADTWHNVAYGIDFDAGEVEFYHSTGSDELEKLAGPVSADTSSNGADWHLGVLRLTNDGSAEDWHFSGVYIESGDLTTSVVSPGGSSEGASSGASPAASSAASSATPSAASSAASSASTAPKASSTAVDTSNRAGNGSSNAATGSVPSSTPKAAANGTESSNTSSSADAEESCVVEYVYV